VGDPAAEGPARPAPALQAHRNLAAPGAGPDWPAEMAQRLIGVALKATLERCVRFVLVAALGLWAASLALPALGVR
jgi:hypothetical protein